MENYIIFMQQMNAFLLGKNVKKKKSVNKQKLKIYDAEKIRLRIPYGIWLNTLKVSQVLIFAWDIQAEFIAT